MNGLKYKNYICKLCGFIYKEQDGCIEEGIAPGTKWEDIPLTWQCPDCNKRKSDFIMVDI